MQFLEFVGGGRANGGNARAAEVAHIMELPEEVLEKAGDTVWAGEDQPVIRIQFEQGIHEVLLVLGRFDANGGHFQHLRAELAQTSRDLRGLMRGARDDNSLPE